MVSAAWQRRLDPAVVEAAPPAEQPVEQLAEQKPDLGEMSAA